jgi:hypothetical protein
MAARFGQNATFFRTVCETFIKNAKMQRFCNLHVVLKYCMNYLDDWRLLPKHAAIQKTQFYMTDHL